MYISCTATHQDQVLWWSIKLNASRDSFQFSRTENIFGFHAVPQPDPTTIKLFYNESTNIDGRIIQCIDRRPSLQLLNTLYETTFTVYGRFPLHCIH